MSIRSKLVIIFICIAVIPLVLVSAFTFDNFKNSLEVNRLAQLNDLSIFRADRIDAYFAGLKADIQIAQGYINIKMNLPVLARSVNHPDNPQCIVARKILAAQLKQMQSVSQMTDIMLAAPSGIVVYSNDPRHLLKDLTRGIGPEQQAIEQGKTGVYFSDVYFDKEEDKRFEMLISAPASNSKGAPIGVIVFEVGMTPVYNLIQDVTGLGNSGEVLVGKKTGNQIEFLNPLRHDPKAALKRKATLGDQTSYPIQQAVQGKSGVGKAVDYRGEQVIAAWKFIPSMGWGLVAKIDIKEAYADVTHLRNMVLLILIIVCGVCTLLAFVFAQSVSKPIKQLTEGAHKIGQGNLDIKLGNNQHDEIGALSRSFDKMTEDLRMITASRNELNKEIDDRKKAESALLKTTDDLARSNRDLEQFAYVASHDLQEPLRAVAGFMGLLKNQYQGIMDKTAQEYIDFAVEGAERMQTLIHDLLGYSRVGTKGKKFSLFPLQEALDNALKNLKISIDESEAMVTSGDLPHVNADASQITQLFQNLIGNAIKFCGPQAPAITVDAKRKDGHITVSVTDNGIGIEPQYFERIFLIFQRLHGRTQYKGTGIGLAVCKRIVERHRGEIWIESKPGVGSIFYFTIPDSKEDV